MPKFNEVSTKDLEEIMKYLREDNERRYAEIQRIQGELMAIREILEKRQGS